VRIIEYLNEQLQTTEVVGIEVVPHAGSASELVAYVPAVRGQTASVPRTKGAAERRTRQEFEDKLLANHGDAALQSVNELVEATAGLGGFPTIGADVRNPRLFVNFKTRGTGALYWPIAVNSRAGKVAIQLRWLANHPAFADEDRRAEIVERMQTAIGAPIDAPRLDGFPGFHVNVLTRPGVVERLTGVFRWMQEVAERPADEGDGAPT
jgi:hypothetical protein